ncbi:unnamed protein product [Cuscuta epithymum]|uniref:Uncharacterized protein n=1 Tax=Cuscuta epithymum TaxID=186058 RepID=A0AAV0GMM3_9ASTE|nr:unnamed protein product [Cuscuta epithymum]
MLGLQRPNVVQGRETDAWSQAVKGHGRSMGLVAGTDLESRSFMLGGDRGGLIEIMMKKSQGEEEATVLLDRPLLNRRHGVHESLGFGSSFLIVLFVCDLFFIIRLFIFPLVTFIVVRL